MDGGGGQKPGGFVLPVIHPFSLSAETNVTSSQADLSFVSVLAAPFTNAAPT